VEFTELPPRALKGIADPVGLVDVRPASRGGSTQERDAVCGMGLAAADVAAVILWKGRSYAFCSPECAQLFRDAPRRYAQRSAGDAG